MWIWFCDWTSSDHQSCLRRLYISLFTSCPAKILIVTTAVLHFCPPAVEFCLSTRWTHAIWERVKLGQGSVTNSCDQLWLASLTQKIIFFPHDGQHVIGIRLLWRSSPYWESLCQVRWYVSTSTQFFPQHATHSLAFLVNFAVLSVGGVREKRGRESENDFEQTPSKAKDEMSHLGEMLLGGIRVRLATWHQPLKQRMKKMERHLCKPIWCFVEVWRHRVVECRKINYWPKS